MNIPILSFNSGELSPLIDSRSDVEKYSSGCRHLDRFYPRIYGAAERIQGTKYISSQYISTNTLVRKIPFIFSSTVSYSLEFGDEYILPRSIVTNGGVKVTINGNEVVQTLNMITSPYLAADLFELQYKQLGDTMWITHRNYAQRKLTRVTQADFELNEVEYKKGPFLIRNDLISPDATNAAYMILSATDSNVVSTGDDNQQLVFAANPKAQTFTPLSDCTITSITLKLFKHVTTPGTISSVSVNIYNTVFGLFGSNYVYGPTGSSLGGVTISEATIVATSQATAAFYGGAPSSTITLNGGTTYAIVVSSVGGNGTDDYVGWNADNTPAAGSTNDRFQTLNSTNSGVTWTQMTPDRTSMFNVQEAITAYIPGSTGTMSCVTDDGSTAVNYFEAGHLGSLFKLTFPRTDKVSKGKYTGGGASDANPFILCAPIDVKGSMHFNLKGHLRAATVELQRNENSAGWETVEIYEVINDVNETYSRVEDADNVQYRAIITAITFTTTDPYLKANITVANSMQDCVVKVTSVTSSSAVAIEVMTGKGTTGITRRWAEGAWSPLRGFPVSTAFYEDRCCFTAMKDIQTQVLYDNAPPHSEPSLPTAWHSHTGDYENFEAGVKDADSFEVTIPSANDVRWIESMEALVLGTSGDEWRIGSNKMQQPITPTNYSVRQQSSYGNKLIQPMKINDQLLFVNFVGRKLLESAYDGDKYRAIDLTSLAEHITLTGIVDMAYQRNPDSIIWCVLADGSLIGMVYEKYEKVIAWFKVPIDGKVQSVCVTTSADEDDVWISIKRNIGGSDVIYIEKFASRTFTYIEDAYFIDAGLTYTLSEIVQSGGEDVLWDGRIVMIGSTFHTVSELDHLNGETVSVLADGEPYAYLPVASGSITLPTGVYPQKVQVGLPYRSKLQPMRIVISSGAGSSAGLITRIPKMNISFLNTMDAEYGANDDTLLEINWDDTRWENSADTVTGTFTGEVDVTLNGGFSVLNPIIISTDAPLPCVVRSIMPRLEVTGA